MATIDGLGAKLEKVLIDGLVENTFHAKLVLKTEDGKNKEIDSRPSDAIALAVRAHASIYVSEEVLKKASIFESS